jgi:hypothetical protein
MRNGSMLLVFDEEVKPAPKIVKGHFEPQTRCHLLKLGGSLALAKLADDSVDETIGASKARYVGAAPPLAFYCLQREKKPNCTPETLSRFIQGDSVIR